MKVKLRAYFQEVQMQILAHRGYHVHVPENTMAAFEAAAALGVNGIETDVRVTRDGALVLIHDRVTKSGELIAQLTRSQLEKTMGYEVPVLEEALKRWPDLLWNIEIKVLDAVADNVRLLKQIVGRTQILISSFRHDMVIQCASQLDIDCALLFANRPAEIGDTLKMYSKFPRIRTVVWDFNILDTKLIRELRESGWRNYIYGPVTQAEHINCVEANLDGIITDYPERVLAQP
jgi:glycerophosphoryl diester phosphodiesterase